MKRRYLTKRERADMAHNQGHLCGCGCDQPLGKETIGEHVYILVAWGNEGKPDSLWRKDCSLKKTKEDMRKHARVRRLQGLTGQLKRRKARGHSLIQGRNTLAKGGLKRTFSGEVVPR
jgi:hypothetical protein